MLHSTTWTIAEWQQAYREGASVQTLLSNLLTSLTNEDNAWIALLDNHQLNQELTFLEQRLAAVKGDLTKLPLYGIPFAVKDNIDVLGFNTTCACPEFSYQATQDAYVVGQLKAAGAIVIGKTNLDQFATGLVGTRSPYGAVANSFNAEFISGGSSSGSAVVVAKGLVPFSLGTDTAGSGRVPAGFNNIVGLKPTRGYLSTRGVFPACRSLDCVSIFALSVEDAEYVAGLAGGFDNLDPYSRLMPVPPIKSSQSLVLGIPSQLQTFGDSQSQAAFEQAVAQWQSLGAEVVAIDFTPLFQVANLLYEGGWLAERYVAIEEFWQKYPHALHPVVAAIIERAKELSASDVFKGQYQLAELSRTAAQIYQQVDALLVPTTPTIFRHTEVEADPIQLNSQLGTYTNFVNLLDGCALAIPAGQRADGLPFGITLIAPAWQDSYLAKLANLWRQKQTYLLGASQKADRYLAPSPALPLVGERITVAVVGAHLAKMPLNYQLQERHAQLLETTFTSDSYRFFALSGSVPPKPALLRVSAGQGASIVVELWSMPVEHFGSFVALIPPPLGIGTLQLIDGREVKGFICEPWALTDAQEITSFGGWRNFISHKQAKE